MQSSEYLLSQAPFSTANANSICVIPLPGGVAGSLKAIARVDACSLWYSGCLSLAQAVNGIHQTRYGWATVKLYYAAYYLLRARLLLDGWCQFYVASKPRAVEAKPGALVQKLQGTSHEACYKLFEVVYPTSSLISQHIGVDPARVWLKDRREIINYNVARFPDPDHPEWFDVHVSNGIRSMVSSYLADPSHYAYLPDHAMVAYPIAAALDLVGAMRREGMSAEVDDKSKIQGYWRDTQGPLPSLELLVP